METLDTIPKEKGIDVRKALLAFHDKYYSSNIMALTVLGKETLDQLQDLVLKLFKDVKNKSIEVPSWPDHPYNVSLFDTTRDVLHTLVALISVFKDMCAHGRILAAWVN